MNITFILPPVNMSGGIRVVAIYAEQLVKRGHEVVLISPPPPKVPMKRKIKSLLKGSGWPRYVKRMPSHLDGLDLDHRILDRFRPPTDPDVPDADVVVATWWETAEWVYELSEKKGVKVYFIQGYEVFSYLPIDRVRQTYRLPLHKIVVARWLQRVMEDEYGDHDLDIVPNAVDHEQFFACPRPKCARPTVGFLNHHVPSKGLDITLKAVKELLKSFPNLRIVSFGSFRLAEHIELKPRIEFFYDPPQDRIREIYAMCDVWLTASRSEGFNLPAMEAMACRTPVVSTKTGWPEEAIVDGYNGALVEVDDWKGLAAAAKTVLSMADAEWRKQSNNAYLTVRDSNWTVCTNLFEKALFNAIKQSKQ